MKLWLKFQLNQSIFLFLSLKSVIVNFGFLHLFLDIWIQNPDPDSEYGSGLKLNADPTGSGSETLPMAVQYNNTDQWQCSPDVTNNPAVLCNARAAILCLKSDA
jgi:hypothetical protein